MNIIKKDIFVQQYFARIFLEDFGQPTLDSLKKIIAAHICYIPFEFTWYNSPPFHSLELDSLFSKIILSNKGGYCYETGILFNHLLKMLGFSTHLIVGQIYRQNVLDTSSVHLATIVQLDKNFLVDISWRGGIPTPISLDKSVTQTANNKMYKIANTHLGFDVWEKYHEWKKAYLVRPLGNPLDLIKYQHIFHQYDKKSEFYGKKILKYSQINNAS